MCIRDSPAPTENFEKREYFMEKQFFLDIVESASKFYNLIIDWYTTFLLSLNDSFTVYVEYVLNVSAFVYAIITKTNDLSVTNFSTNLHIVGLIEKHTKI